MIYSLQALRRNCTRLRKCVSRPSTIVAVWTAGIPPLSNGLTSFVAQLWNRNGFVPARQAVPREVTAHIRNVLFPLTSGNACDYGRPFYVVQSPVVRYEAAVGTAPGATNVQDYQVRNYCNSRNVRKHLTLVNFVSGHLFAKIGSLLKI